MDAQMVRSPGIMTRHLPAGTLSTARCRMNPVSHAIVARDSIMLPVLSVTTGWKATTVQAEAKLNSRINLGPDTYVKPCGYAMKSAPYVWYVVGPTCAAFASGGGLLRNERGLRTGQSLRSSSSWNTSA